MSINRKISLFTFLLLSTVHLFGLSRIDSLTQVVHGLRNKEELIRSKLLLLAELINENEIERAESIVQELRLESLTSLQKGELQYDEGMIHQSHYDYRNAMKFFLESNRIGMNEGDLTLKQSSNFRIAELFFKENEFDQCISIIERILDEGTSDKVFLSKCHEVLGDAYFQQKIFGKAKVHFKSALELKINTKQYDGAATLASFLGVMVRDLKEYDEALNYHRMSLTWHQSQANVMASANDYYQIALVQSEMGDYDEGIENVSTALQLINERKKKVEAASYYALVGQLYSKKNNKHKAMIALNKSISLLSDKKDGAEGYYIFENIANTCHVLGDNEMAYQVHKEFVEAHKINGSIQKARELGVMKMRFESEFQTEKSKQEIDKLEMINTYNDKVKIFLFSLLAMMFLLVGYVFRSLKMKKKINNALQKRNAIIEEQGKEILLKNTKLANVNNTLEELNEKLVTEISERESIEHSSFSRDKFLATISQEMKTPLTAIIGMSNLLLDDNPRSDQMDRLRELQFSANDLTVFINDILDFSKIEAGKLSISKREFKLEAIVDDICDRFDKQFDKKGVTFACQYDAQIPETIYGDDIRINQILNNFIVYALADQKTNHIKSTISLVEVEDNCVDLKFDVWFDGEVISPERIAKLFKQSNPGDDSFVGYPHRLLGVAIAKRMVDLQDGNFDVTTSVEDGNHFSVLLSYTLLDADRIIYTKEEQINMLKDKRILVVEDNKINQLVVANMLEKLGMQVVVADNGAEGLSRIVESDFDMVLMDIQMPIMDGYKATSEIRKLTDANKSQVPIIALTASAFLTEGEKAKLFGMDDHVGKPFSLDDLVDKITLLLMGKQQSGQ